MKQQPFVISVFSGHVVEKKNPIITFHSSGECQALKCPCVSDKLCNNNCVNKIVET